MKKVDNKRKPDIQENIFVLNGNKTVINPEKEIIPDYQMCAVTESIDDIDGNGPPIISEKNVLIAKKFVDDENKK